MGIVAIGKTFAHSVVPVHQRRGQQRNCCLRHSSDLTFPEPVQYPIGRLQEAPLKLSPGGARFYALMARIEWANDDFARECTRSAHDELDFSLCGRHAEGTTRVCYFCPRVPAPAYDFLRSFARWYYIGDFSEGSFAPSAEHRS